MGRAKRGNRWMTFGAVSMALVCGCTGAFGQLRGNPAVVAAPLPEDGSPRPPMGNWPVVPRDQFDFFWCGASSNPDPGVTWRDWAAMMNFGEAPVRRDITMLYEWEFREFPMAGVHQVENDPDFYSRWPGRVAWALEFRRVPADYTGYIAIDFEAWIPLWSLQYNEPSNRGPLAHDLDFKDDWRDFIRQYRPQLVSNKTAAQQEAIFEQTYNEAGKRLFLTTIQEVKRQRPNAKVGFYLFPPRSYHDYQTADRAAAFKQKIREPLQWMWDAQDVFFPDIYAVYYTVPGVPNYRERQESMEEGTRYLLENVREAVELANGRPVIPFIWYRYHVNAGPYDGQLVNPMQIRNTIEVAYLSGANGVAMWDAFRNDTSFQQAQDYVSQTLVPKIAALRNNQPWPTGTRPPSNASSGSGSGSPAPGGSASGGNSGSSSGGNSGSGGSTPVVQVRRDENPPKDNQGQGGSSSGNSGSSQASSDQGGGSNAGSGSNAGGGNTQGTRRAAGNNASRRNSAQRVEPRGGAGAALGPQAGGRNSGMTSTARRAAEQRRRNQQAAAQGAK